jgi:3D (Asp-Asp-Asp) domain-containing protein
LGSIFGILTLGAIGWFLSKNKPAKIFQGVGYRQISNAKLTYYYVVDLVLGNVPIYTTSGVRIASLSSSSFNALKTEGTGKLPDGRIVHWQYGSTCDVRPAGSQAYGSRSNRLTPMASIATDTTVIPFGSVVYITALGIWVTADDVGGRIKGAHIDLFTGTASVARRYLSTTSTDLIVFDINS